MSDSDDSGAGQRPEAHGAAAWLNLLFNGVERAPGLIRGMAPLLAYGAWLWAKSMRRSTRANAVHLRPDASRAEQARMARRVISNFIRFVCDVAQGSRRTVRDLQEDQVASVEGVEHYEAAKAMGRGLIVATAHLGSFEVGMAELLRKEPKLHVVFQRDPVEPFERMRSRLHAQLGVIEAAVDDGWEVWIRLREALERGEAVAMQADRVMPGQKGAWVPFADGQIALPLGPVKLAKLAGAPILPVFAPVEADGRVRLVIEPAIVVDEVVAPGQTPAALIQLARTLERTVLKYPDQWLVLFDAWKQDTEAGL